MITSLMEADDEDQKNDGEEVFGIVSILDAIQDYQEDITEPPEKLDLVKMELHLKRSQMVSDNKWSCTIDGEKRLVTSHVVQYYATSMSKALSSFDKEEINQVSIVKDSYLKGDG